MRATSRMVVSVSALAVPLLLLVAGFLVTFFVPGVGCAGGPLLCVLAIFMGGKRRKIWLCDKCGGSFERA
jgi:hypothetical protein